MADYHVMLSPKIGDVLYGKAVLDRLVDRYDAIHVSINQSMYVWRSPNWDVGGDYSRYHRFMQQLYEWLFSEKNYRIELDRNDYPYRDWPEICREQGVEPVKPRLRSYLKPHMKAAGQFPQDYIVVMTKCVSFDHERFAREGEPIWQALREKAGKMPILVMGEREVEPCYERRLHTVEYCSLYPLICEKLSGVAGRHWIDLTVPGLGITCTPFEKFQQDCWIASGARACVTFGFGGAFCMATSFGNAIGYVNRPSAPTDSIFKNGTVDDCLATSDVGLCAKAIEEA